MENLQTKSEKQYYIPMRNTSVMPFCRRPSQQILSKKQELKMMERFLSIM